MEDFQGNEEQFSISVPHPKDKNISLLEQGYTVSSSENQECIFLPTTKTVIDKFSPEPARLGVQVIETFGQSLIGKATQYSKLPLEKASEQLAGDLFELLCCTHHRTHLTTHEALTTPAETASLLSGLTNIPRNPDGIGLKKSGDTTIIDGLFEYVISTNPHNFGERKLNQSRSYYQGDYLRMLKNNELQMQDRLLALMKIRYPHLPRVLVFNKQSRRLTYTFPKNVAPKLMQRFQGNLLVSRKIPINSDDVKGLARAFIQDLDQLLQTGYYVERQTPNLFQLQEHNLHR